MKAARNRALAVKSRVDSQDTGVVHQASPQAGSVLPVVLLLLQGVMKTQAGAAVAQQRHAFMEAYLQQFLLEWEGTA